MHDDERTERGVWKYTLTQWSIIQRRHCAKTTKKRMTTELSCYRRKPITENNRYQLTFVFNFSLIKMFLLRCLTRCFRCSLIKYIVTRLSIEYKNAPIKRRIKVCFTVKITSLTRHSKRQLVFYLDFFVFCHKQRDTVLVLISINKLLDNNNRRRNHMLWSSIEWHVQSRSKQINTFDWVTYVTSWHWSYFLSLIFDYINNQSELPNLLINRIDYQSYVFFISYI